MKASDYSAVHLCSDCPRQAPDAYHAVGKRAFEKGLRKGPSKSSIGCRGRASWLGSAGNGRRGVGHSRLEEIDVPRCLTQESSGLE
jgi:hypothetical protein